MKFLTWRQQLGKPECPYAERWMLNLGPLGSIRLHRWISSDDLRAMHDHPSDFVTLVLKGQYIDKFSTNDGVTHQYQVMKRGRARRRKAEHKHSVMVPKQGCWTLLYFFPERREWGFWVPRKDTGKLRFRKHNKYFYEFGHHPCDQD